MFRNMRIRMYLWIARSRLATAQDSIGLAMEALDRADKLQPPDAHPKIVSPHIVADNPGIERPPRDTGHPRY